MVGKCHRNISLERYTCETEVSVGGWVEAGRVNVAKIRDT